MSTQLLWVGVSLSRHRRYRQCIVNTHTARRSSSVDKSSGLTPPEWEDFGVTTAPGTALNIVVERERARGVPDIGGDVRGSDPRVWDALRAQRPIENRLSYVRRLSFRHARLVLSGATGREYSARKHDDKLIFRVKVRRRRFSDIGRCTTQNRAPFV